MMYKCHTKIISNCIVFCNYLIKHTNFLDDNYEIIIKNKEYNKLYILADIYIANKKYDKAEKCYGYLINIGHIKAVFLLVKMLDDLEKFYYYTV